MHNTGQLPGVYSRAFFCDFSLVRSDFGVFAVVPLVENVGRGRHISLLVESDLAHYGVEFRAAHRRRYLVEVGRSSLFHSLLEDLKSGVGIERVAFRLEALSPELIDDSLGARLVACFRTERHQSTLTGGAGD